MGALTRSRARMPCMLCRRPLRPGACMRLRRAVRLRRGRRRGRSGAVKLGAQLRVRGLEGGGAVGLALPEGSLPFGDGLRLFA
jgi:hypothetical protein